MKIDLEAILHHCEQKSKYDSHLYRNQLNLTTTKIVLTGPTHSKWHHQKNTTKINQFEALVNQLYSRQNVMSDLGVGIDFMSKMYRIGENYPFCHASDYYHTCCSTPIVKYTENESLPASPVNNINMFDKKADIMGMFKFEDQNDGFYQKIPFCDAPDLCLTFLSTPIVNYTENW